MWNHEAEPETLEGAGEAIGDGIVQFRAWDSRILETLIPNDDSQEQQQLCSGSLCALNSRAVLWGLENSGWVPDVKYRTFSIGELILCFVFIALVWPSWNTKVFTSDIAGLPILPPET